MKIALIGYGKMGHAIEEIALERGHQISLKISIDNTEDLTPANIEGTDVAIEFSTPDSAFDNISFCLKNGIPVVSGTTGWLEHFDEAVALCEENKGAFLYASNFSIGVNLFFEVNKYLAHLMAPHQEYNVSMQEIHHIHKKDAPSGTALTLANQIIDSGKKKNWELGKESDSDTLAIESIREGEVPGTHSINYFSDIDQIEITHTAFGRKGFALGAVVAAEFVYQKQGVFRMKDVLGL